jgi:small subunit ribosomal protein S8
MMTDPIADMLTRIRNANSIERPAADMKATKLKANIAQVLKDEGFILDYHVGKIEGGEFKDGAKAGDPQTILRVYLKYGPEGEKVIRAIHRSSRPGRRYYKGAKDLNKVLDGLGIAVLSTSKGVMSDRKARKEGVGGEVLCLVW